MLAAACKTNWSLFLLAKFNAQLASISVVHCYSSVWNFRRFHSPGVWGSRASRAWISLTNREERNDCFAAQGTGKTSCNTFNFAIVLRTGASLYKNLQATLPRSLLSPAVYFFTKLEISRIPYAYEFAMNSFETSSIIEFLMINQAMRLLCLLIELKNCKSGIYT